jgi:hypothetical protein
VAPQPRETSAHRAIATVGRILAAVGLGGLIVSPDLIVVWGFMIFFGVAALPRAALLEWRRARRPRGRG